MPFKSEKQIKEVCISGRLVDCREDVEQDGDIIIREYLDDAGADAKKRCGHTHAGYSGNYRGWVMVNGVRKKIDLTGLCPNNEQHYDYQHSRTSWRPKKWFERMWREMAIIRPGMDMNIETSMTWKSNERKKYNLRDKKSAFYLIEEIIARLTGTNIPYG